MKTFIIFLSLLIINITFVSYQSDLGNYMRLQKNLKALSEDCAAGAALYFDEESYGEGSYVFNYNECEKFVYYILNESNLSSQYKSKAILHFIEYEDDALGYKKEEIPSVTVKLVLETKDLFRLPFMKVKNVTRKSQYELPEFLNWTDS